MNKKAQGLSINVIIVAAIALIVLVILGVIFTGRMGLFSGQASDCEANGGDCIDSTVGCGDNQRLTRGFICADAGDTERVCCMGLNT